MAIQPDEVVHLLESDLVAQGLEKLDFMHPDMTILEAAAFSIRESLTRKWEHDSSDVADAAALKKFLAQNKKCEEWSYPREFDTRTEMLLNGFKSAIYDFWLRDKLVPLFDHPYDLLSKAEIGPGANIGARGGDFYTKFFASPLTCTDDSLYRWYRRYTANFPEWSQAENLRLSTFGGARIVSGSRLSFVPKNDKISRCICTEPTLNTYFQLGLGWHLTLRLRERYGICLHDQQFKNRDLARLGSITDSLITLDLSGASDSISLNMVKSLFPPDFVRWLEWLRCKETQVPGLGTVQLHMISSMGNGYTFPLETLVFSAVVTSAAQLRGIPLGKSRFGNTWGVFGDDIICPSELARDVIHLLDVLGFTVNSDKTFVKGPFRESCGSDFYLGTNIRGVYLRKLDTMPQRYSAINRLLQFSTRTGINLSRLVERIARDCEYLPIPPWLNIDSGIQVPLSMSYRRRDRDTQSHFVMCLEPRLPKIRITEDTIVVPRSQKKRIYNPSGLLVSLLQGAVNSCSISFRSKTVKYRKKRRIVPHWALSESPPRDRLGYDVDWGRWESVVESYSKELGFDPKE
jgi:hypothetical protein